MADGIPPPPRTLGDYANPTTYGCGSSILRPPVQSNNFEIKPTIVGLMWQNQFGGSPLDPHAHITSFIQICDIFKVNGPSDDAIRLRLFSFSLRDKAAHWLSS